MKDLIAGLVIPFPVIRVLFIPCYLYVKYYVRIVS
jgi:hypothetical protein